MKKILFSLMFCTLVCVPFLTQAKDEEVVNDPNIASIDLVNITDDSAGETTSYGINFTLNTANTLEAGDGFTLLVQEVSEGSDPTASGFDFTNAFDGPAIGISGAGTPYEVGGNSVAYVYSLAAAPTATGVTMGIEDIKNGPDGCYKLMMTTSETVDPSANYTYSDPFAIGTGECDEEGDDGKDGEIPEMFEVSAVAFGTNIALKWEAQDDGSESYTYRYSTDSTAFGEGGSGETVVNGNTTDTNIIISDLEPNTTYYGDVASIVGENTVVNGTETFEVTTGDPISEKRFKKPLIKKKKQRTFRVNFKEWKEARGENEMDYVDHIILQIKNKKKSKVVKKYSAISASKNYKDVKKKYTKADKTYYVRMKAEYVTGETTKYSKWVKVKLKTTEEITE